MEQEVVLLGFSTSTYVMRVKIALLEKGVPFHYKEEKDVYENQNKSDLLLKSNPIHKKVPVFIHNGKPICESLIILEYIDEVWKQENQLLSDDPYNQAKARFWIDFFDKKMADCGKRMWPSKGEDQEAAKKEFVACLKLMENELGVCLILEVIVLAFWILPCYQSRADFIHTRSSANLV